MDELKNRNTKKVDTDQAISIEHVFGDGFLFQLSVWLEL